MKTIVVLARRTPISRYNVVQLHRVIQNYVRKNLDPAIKWLEEQIGIKVAWDSEFSAKIIRDVKQNPGGSGDDDHHLSPAPFFTPVDSDDGSAHQLRTTDQVLTWLKHQDDPAKLKLFNGLVNDNGKHFIEDMLEGCWFESITL